MCVRWQPVARRKTPWLSCQSRQLSLKCPHSFKKSRLSCLKTTDNTSVEIYRVFKIQLTFLQRHFHIIGHWNTLYSRKFNLHIRALIVSRFNFANSSSFFCLSLWKKTLSIFRHHLGKCSSGTSKKKEGTKGKGGSFILTSLSCHVSIHFPTNLLNSSGISQLRKIVQCHHLHLEGKDSPSCCILYQVSKVSRCFYADR